MELEKQQYLETFLSIVRGSKNKNQFLKNVQEFDNRFTQVYQGPSFNYKASYESFTTAQQVQAPPKIKNPFINTYEENNKRNYSPARSNNLINSPHANYAQMGPNMLTNNQNKINLPHSRSQQQFFKPNQGSKTYHAGFGLNQQQQPSHVQNQINPPSFNQPNQFEPRSFNLPSFNPLDQVNQGIYQHFNRQPTTKASQNYQISRNLGAHYQNSFQSGQNHQYSDMLKNFANFNLGQHQSYMNPNQLSVNSHQNYNTKNNLNNASLDPQPNQFLANLNSEQQPDFVKYYKRLVPMPNKPQTTNQRSFLDNRVNPFSNK